MRGKANRIGASDFLYRITPAYAGKRKLLAVIASTKQDHPRLCGEKQKVKILVITTIGSPPPMRGKVRGFFILSLIVRITPAYAGKSYSDVIHIRYK